MNTIHLQFEDAAQQFNIGKLDEAERISKHIYELDPDNQDAAHLLAIICYKNGAFINALSFVDAALNILINPQFLNTKGNIFVALGECDLAESSYRDAISIGPKTIDSYNNLSILLRKLNKTNEAILVCKKGLTVDSYHVGILNTLGLCYYDFRQFELAVRYFQKVILIAPNFIMAHLNLARSYYSQGNINDAIAYLSQLQKNYPNNYQIYLSLADVYRDEKNYHEAILAYRNVLEGEQKNFDANNNLGICLLSIGKIKEAIACFYKALDINSDDPTIITNLCICFSSLQNYSLIIELLKKFKPRAEDFDLHQIYIYSAIGYWLSGDKERVRNYLDLSRSRLKSDSLNKSARFSNAYYAYLNTLCDKIDLHKMCDLEKMYFVGDSHTLVHNQQILNIKNQAFYCEAKLVLGCKIWHLIESQYNRFKYALNCALESLPRNSNLVFNIGEIDCRKDEGIILQIKNEKANIAEICEDMALRYVNEITEIACAKQFVIFLMGIPAPVIELEGELSNDQLLQINIVRHINEALKGNCKNRKDITFVDIYSITTDNTGKANPGFHLDDFHVSQTSCQLAFDQVI